MDRISKQAQDNILDFVRHILTVRDNNTDIYDKMEAVDTAYYRYSTYKDPKTGESYGQGIDAATVPAGVFNSPSTVPPIVVSQVESMVGYLSEIFLSGSPIFPIVSNPTNRQIAGALESIIDDHAILGGYPRQLLLFLRMAVKYNLAAVETFYESIDQYSVVDEFLTPDTLKIDKGQYFLTKLQTTDMYNTFWDPNVMPGDISRLGDYAGTVEILSKPRFKRLLNRLSIEKKVLNASEAEKAFLTGPQSPYYRIHPAVSEYVTPVRPFSLSTYLGVTPEVQRKGGVPLVGNYEVIKVYARICPADLGLSAPSPNTPQIYKFLTVNNQHVIQVERIITVYDYLPILFGQPFEDGLWNQTKSIAEGMIPIQQSAETMLNIYFNSARRAVSDRALYDPSVISPKDINAPVPAPKIPVRTNSLNERPIDSYYKSIPFDARGTETAAQSAMQIVSFGEKLSGLNNPMQGQFQKGNKSVKEWNDTMGNSDARLRLPALSLEFQFFTPLKEILKYNILQNQQSNLQTVSQRTGETLSMNPADIRKTALAFQVADGYTPKSKLASTEAIIQIMQFISQSPILQQTMGMMLPQIVAHLAQLMGVKGLDEYMPQKPTQMPPPGNEGKMDILRQEDQDLRQQALDIRAADLGIR